MTAESAIGVTPRSELFLSCDLVGSTAYKQRQGPWEEAFLAFYRQFPEMLGELAAEKAVPFRLWKPIGDELVFQVRIDEEADVVAATRVWLAAMDRYAEDRALAKSGMGTKGGAFIGTFPGPDVEASVRRDPQGERSTIRGLVELNDEALADRDNSVFVFDYFGPSFDTGFRVINQSTPRHFTLSVEVAFAILRAEINDPSATAGLVFLGDRELKGVWKSRNYPLFAIDRLHDDEINVRLRLMSETVAPNHNTWRELCQHCVTSEGWPSRLYLPKSNLTELLEPPPDALNDLRRPNETAGIETKPSKSEERVGAQKLPDSAPLPRRKLIGQSAAAELLGLSIGAFRGLERSANHPPFLRARAADGEPSKVYDREALTQWWENRRATER